MIILFYLLISIQNWADLSTTSRQISGEREMCRRKEKKEKDDKNRLFLLIEVILGKHSHLQNFTTTHPTIAVQIKFVDLYNWILEICEREAQKSNILHQKQLAKNYSTHFRHKQIKLWLFKCFLRIKFSKLFRSHK